MLKIFALIMLLLLVGGVSIGKPAINIQPNSSKIKKPGKQATAGNAAVSIESFGAVPNNPEIDNSPFIQKAIASASDILIPAKKIYYINHAIDLQNAGNKTIYAHGATIINKNYDECFFIFTQCNGIKIDGGYFTRPVLPTVQDGKNQCTLSFVNCKSVTVTNTHINRSPEMGINLNVVIGANISYNTIEHCLRDGVYAHYSANLKYIGNILNEIKDDALSMHDYGIDAQKEDLHKAGYSQAGHSLISGNTISNAIQGISSIGCTNILITKNTIKKTVNTGIIIFNDEQLYPGTTARVNNITISNNRIDRSGDTVLINGLTQINYAQNSGGRAAIFIGCNSTNQYFKASKLRLSKIKVIYNKVTNSALNGITVVNVDDLLLANNNFENCHTDTRNAPGYTGNIIELYNCNQINVRDNIVNDSRKPI